MAYLSKTGYVVSYKVEINTTVNAGTYHFYVIVADDHHGANSMEFRIPRNISGNFADLNTDGTPWAVPRNSIEQAVIATLKDALLHDKKVAVYYTEAMVSESNRRDRYNQLHQVEIFAR